MYLTEKKRKDLKKDIISIDDWLKTLNISVKIEEYNEANAQRTIQLLNKTNQMNLATRRLIKSELDCWIQRKECKLWTFRVSDKFGDMGITGILSMEIKDNKGKIVDFLLSCRVFGRNIEHLMLYHSINYAKSKKLDKIELEYIATEKNKISFY